MKMWVNRFYGVINPDQIPDLNTDQAVWDHLDREQSKRLPTSKEKLQNLPQEAWRTIPEDYFLILRKFANDSSSCVKE